jgi:hypothetical protein
MRPTRWLSLIIIVSAPAVAGLTGLFQDFSWQAVDESGPVAGARIRFRGERRSTTTDARGHFSLSPGRKNLSQISVSREGVLTRTFPAAGPARRLRIAHLPGQDNEDYAWVEPGPVPSGAGNCVRCHGQIHDEWRGSAHARSATNRHFLGYYDGSDWHGRRQAGWSLRADNPDGAAVCAACHAPTVSARKPAFEDIRRAEGVDRRGAHCDFCHKISQAAVDERGLTFGRFGYTLHRPRAGQLFFGPLDDAERRGESFSYSPLYRQSRYCASCHEGVIFGVPVYTTYSEWLVSSARRQGQECQSCHMTPTGRLTNIAPGKGGIERDPLTLASHRFPGSQAAMLRRCLSLSVQLVRTDKEVRVQVVVRADRVGHRVPTGFIDRNLVLLVEGFHPDGLSASLREGPTLPELAGHALAGKAGRLFAKQLQDKSTRGPIPFWRFHGTIVDTRLEPGRVDQADFVFEKRTDRVRVRLIYRRSWSEVAQTKGWPDNEIEVVERTAR